MATVVVVLVIAGLVGGVVWNKRNAALAMEGVQFSVPQGPEAVAAAISQAYCGGARAKARAMVSRVTVTSSGRTSFRTRTKIDDVGLIEVHAREPSGSIVRAATTSLYVGAHPATHSKGRGIWAMSSAINHLIYTALGITPNAARMKRFQRALQKQVTKQLRRSAVV